LRAANEALIEQTKLLNLIVTSIGDGLLVVDRDGAALLSNPALRRMLGLKENENIPKNCARDCGFFHADKVTRIAPEEAPTSRQSRENILTRMRFLSGTRPTGGIMGARDRTGIAG
jgi:PAS domain S-box-containing protein